MIANRFYTPRYSVCVPAGDHWPEMSAHTTEQGALEAHGLQLMTDPDAVVWDWRLDKIIAGGDAA